jgi:apolipoprotein N-acyltransferase
VIGALAATLLSAVLYSLAFPPLRLWPLAFVCLAPFLVALRRVGRRAGPALGLLWAETAALLVADALPASTQRYFAQSALVSWLFAAAVYTLTAGVYYAAFAALYQAIAARRVRALPWLAAAAWVTVELARARLVTGESFWSNPWALAGYALVGVDPLVQVASLGGVFAISFLVVLPNAALAELWRARAEPVARRRAGIALASACLPALGALAFGAAALAGAAEEEAGRPALRVAVVQADPELGSQWRADQYGRNLEAQLELTVQAARHHAPHIVVWSESALAFHLEREPVFRSRISRVLAEHDLELLAGGPSGVETLPPRYFNSVFALDAGGRVRGRYDKQVLIPFSEYLPLASVNLVRRRFDGVEFFSPGPHTDPLPTRAGPAGVLVCSEGMLAPLARRRVLAGATWLVSPSNDTWIARPKWAELTFDLVSLRAVEQRRYLVRASSSGPSGAVDPWGRVLARTPPTSRAVLGVEIRPRSDLTPYARLGDLFALACAAAVALALARGLVPGWRAPRTRRGEEAR